MRLIASTNAIDSTAWKESSPWANDLLYVEWKFIGVCGHPLSFTHSLYATQLSYLFSDSAWQHRTVGPLLWAKITGRDTGRFRPEFVVGTLVQSVLRFSKNTAQNSPIHAISTEKKIFFRGGAYPPLHTPRPVDLTPRPSQTIWIRLCVPQKSSQTYS